MILIQKIKLNKNKKNKIIFLYNIKTNNIKNIIDKIENKKIIKINNNKIEKIKELNKKNNIIIINNEKNNLNCLKKYFKISDKIIIYIKSEVKSLKKIYFLINKLGNKYKINKDKIILIIEKNNKKNGIYYLVIKDIFKNYESIYINKEKIISKNEIKNIGKSNIKRYK